MTAHLTGPVQASERIQTLDILRGFALMGILIMNMPGFARRSFPSRRVAPMDLACRPICRAGARHAVLGQVQQHVQPAVRDRFHHPVTRASGTGPEHADAMYLRRLLVLAPGDWCTPGLLARRCVAHLRHPGSHCCWCCSRASDRGIVIAIALCLLYPLVSGTLRLLVVTPRDHRRAAEDRAGLGASNNAAYGHGSFATLRSRACATDGLLLRHALVAVEHPRLLGA